MTRILGRASFARPPDEVFDLLADPRHEPAYNPLVMKEHLEGTSMAGTARSQPPETRSRPLLGLRRRPGRLALLVFRLPLPLYRAGWGWLFLGRTFLVLTHVGRKTGHPHATAVMALAEDRATGEVVICSVWGPHAAWIRNLRAHPALRVQIGRTTFTPQHRFLTDQEAFAVGADFRHRHPWRVRLLGRVLGVDLRSDAGIVDFIATRPFVALRPAEPSAGERRDPPPLTEVK